MMAYDSGHVACVIVAGQVKREQNEGSERTVRIPFDSEYAIRIKNKTNLRSLVKVMIDGTICAERLLLRPQQSIDLERFVIDGDLQKGNRFKFVRAANPNVQDPTAGENGLIQVIVEPEYQFTYAYNPPISWWLWNTPVGQVNYGGAGGGGGCAGGGAGSGGAYQGQPVGGTFMNVSSNSLNLNNCTNSGGSGSANGLVSNCTTSHSYSSASVTPTSAHVELPKDAGATIEGSQSYQRFYETNEWFQTTSPITIPIRLRGPKQVEKFWHLEASSRTFYRTDNRGQYDSWSVEGNQLVLRLPIDQVKIA